MTIKRLFFSLGKFCSMLLLSAISLSAYGSDAGLLFHFNAFISNNTEPFLSEDKPRDLKFYREGSGNFLHLVSEPDVNHFILNTELCHFSPPGEGEIFYSWKFNGRAENGAIHELEIFVIEEIVAFDFINQYYISIELLSEEETARQEEHLRWKQSWGDALTSHARENFLSLEPYPFYTLDYDHALDSPAKRVDKNAFIYSCSLDGLNENIPKQNQDSFGTLKFPVSQRSEGIYVHVMDGHGKAGGDFSRAASDKILRSLKKIISDGKKEFGIDVNFTVNTLQNVTSQAEFDIVAQNEVPTALAGSTYTGAVIGRNHIIVANAGDGAAVLGRKRSDGTYESHFLNNLHKISEPSSPQCWWTASEAEQTRVAEMGGELWKSYSYDHDFRMGFSPTRLEEIFEGEVPHEIASELRSHPGLIPTRTFGDTVAKLVGSTSQLEFTITPIDIEDRFLVVASDGVWEILPPQEVMQMVVRHGKDAAQKIAEAAQVRSRSQFLGDADDTTVVVVFFHQDLEKDNILFSKKNKRLPKLNKKKRRTKVPPVEKRDVRDSTSPWTTYTSTTFDSEPPRTGGTPIDADVSEITLPSVTTDLDDSSSMQ